MSEYSHLEVADPEAFRLNEEEERNQVGVIRLTASENLVSHAIREAMSSPSMNRYAEGYPGRRYYGGLTTIDKIEQLAIDRAKQLFEAEHVNVQPNSGSPSNNVVYRALLNPGDTFLGMDLKHGGHLTHGHPASFSGKDYDQKSYGVDIDTGLIDIDSVAKLAKEHNPKMILVGASAYPRAIDYAPFAEIAQKIRAYLVVDPAHILGLIAAKEHPNPVQYADVVSTTTHKTMRGPRGGMIMSKKEDSYPQHHPVTGKKKRKNLAQMIDSEVFPGLQGGPHVNTILAKAVAFGEALQPEFKEYIRQVKANAKALAEALLHHDWKLVSGGTDTHLILADLREKDFTGKDVERWLEEAGIFANANTVPGDQRSPFKTSGLRVGTSVVTSMGMQEEHMTEIAQMMNQIVMAQGENIDQIKARVGELCSQFEVRGITEGLTAE